MAHFGTSAGVLGCVMGIGLLGFVGACDDGAAATVQPSACLQEFPRADASVADEMTIDEAVTECEDDDGACQASATCTGSAEGRDCDANKLISAAAAACIAAEAGLEQGIGDFRTGLTYHYGYRRIVWDVSNVLYDNDSSDAGDLGPGNQGGESVAIDAISGEAYQVLQWFLIADRPVLDQCDSVLVSQEELVRCSVSDACEQVVEQADRVVHWRLTVRRYFDDADGMEYEIDADELAMHTECVMDRLRDLQTTPTLIGDDLVEVDASFNDIESVLHTAAVSDFEVTCVEDDCERCKTFSVEECQADALCAPLMGQRLDPQRHCYERLPAGCDRSYLLCGDALTTALAPDEACWMFPSTCQPAAFTYTDSQDPTCGYAQFDNIEECPEP